MEFWTTFLSEKEELASESPDPESMNRVLDLLTKVDSRLYFHVGLTDDSADLIISAEGNPDLMETISNIVESAPQLDGWRFLPVYDGLALFGERNNELYPNSANGNCLFQRVQDGDKPWIPRPVDFNLVFPSESAAIDFSKHLQIQSIKSEVSAYDGAEGHTHQIYIKKEMTPTLKDIEKFENHLQGIAEEFGGRNDGWGSFNV